MNPNQGTRPQWSHRTWNTKGGRITLFPANIGFPKLHSSVHPLFLSGGEHSILAVASSSPSIFLVPVHVDLSSFSLTNLKFCSSLNLNLASNASSPAFVTSTCSSMLLFDPTMCSSWSLKTDIKGTFFPHYQPSLFSDSPGKVLTLLIARGGLARTYCPFRNSVVFGWRRNFCSYRRHWGTVKCFPSPPAVVESVSRWFAGASTCHLRWAEEQFDFAWQFENKP